MNRTDAAAGIEIEIGRCKPRGSLELVFDVRAAYFPPGSDHSDLRDARARIAPGVRSLVSAARDYTRDPAAQRLVCSKGALLALHLDRELRSSGRRLEEVFPLLTRSSKRLSTEDIRGIFTATLGEPTTRLFDAYVTSAGRLLPLELPAATGRSGCARFLP